ncbi:DUF4440 domain-containing protein [Christiangramia fulva]|nr:nuclear transport factor 2 family protein [Christiangramia fulva]
MKVFKLFPLFVLLIFASCDNQNRENENMEEETSFTNPEEMNRNWVNAWNSNQPDSLEAMTADDAVLLLEGGKMYDRDSISSWYEKGASMMKDLKTNAEIKNSDDHFAYEAGTYSHNYKNDSTDTKYEGTYVVIWERDSLDWKVKVMSITDKAPDSTAANME